MSRPPLPSHAITIHANILSRFFPSANPDASDEVTIWFATFLTVKWQLRTEQDFTGSMVVLAAAPSVDFLTRTGLSNGNPEHLGQFKTHIPGLT